jgi:hypothetical protein
LSDGELTRGFTRPSAGLAKSDREHVTKLDFDVLHIGRSGAADQQVGEVALVMEVVVAVVTKSSAVSVCSFPALAIRETVAIRPSGFPVLKKN